MVHPTFDYSITFFHKNLTQWMPNAYLLNKSQNNDHSGNFITFFFILLYFWPHWVFIAARGLSLVVASWDYSSLWCAGFSLRWLLLLQSTGSRHTGFSSCSTQASVVAACGLRSCGTQALEHVGFSSCNAWALGSAGFSSCGSRALEHRLSRCGAWA